MALAQVSEDARSLHGFKNNQKNPQKKNPLRGVEHRDAVSGSESIAAQRVLKARRTLLHACPLLHASPASPGRCQRQDVEINIPWWHLPSLLCAYTSFPLPQLGNSLLLLRCLEQLQVLGARGRMSIPSSMLSLVFPTLAAALRADSLSGPLW